MFQRRTFKLVAVPDDRGVWTVTVERAPELQYRGRTLGKATSMLQQQLATRFGLDAEVVRMTIDVKAPTRV